MMPLPIPLLIPLTMQFRDAVDDADTDAVDDVIIVIGHVNDAVKISKFSGEPKMKMWTLSELYK